MSNTIIVSMLNFLNNKYKKLGPGRLHLQISILGFFADTSALLYINWFALDKYLSRDVLALNFALHGIDINQMPPGQLANYKEILINSMGTTLALFLAFHAIVYYMFFKGKLWARKYVFGYTLTTVLLSIIEGVLVVPSEPAWGAALIAMTLVYFYMHMGVRFIKKQEQ